MRRKLSNQWELISRSNRSKGTKMKRKTMYCLAFAAVAAVIAPPWTLAAAGPAPVDLRSTAHFTILAGAAVTSTGGGIINGDVGASPIAGSAIGVTAAQVNGTIYAVDGNGPAGSVKDPVLLTAAKGDLTTAYNDAAGRKPVPTGSFLDPGAGNIGGMNLVPGLYKFTGTALITGSNVTLTGGASDVWIFQIGADLQVGSGIHVVLAGGARAKNIFWQVGSSAVLDTFSVFKGTIMADQAITMKTSSTIEGRALAFSAGVTFNGDNMERVSTAARLVINDYDGDRRSDLAVFNASNGLWYIETITRNVLAWAKQWGSAGAVPTPGDYDGDGKADLSVCFTNSALWYCSSLANGLVSAWSNHWGLAGVVPVPGDYDGDGKTDLAAYDGARGNWYIKTLTDNVLAWDVNWGWKGAIPVPGDYDGDGADDLAVFDNVHGLWYVRSLTRGVIAWGEPWGWKGAIPVSGDYDGDGTYDLAAFDNVHGLWYVRSLTRGVIAWGESWGWNGAIPVSGDYDGDGTYDLAVFDNVHGLWYIRSLTRGVITWAQPWGWNGAVPVGGGSY